MEKLEDRILNLLKELEEEKRLADKRAKQLYLAGASFIGHPDTPAAYAAQAGKFVKVNAVPDALIFASIAWGDVGKTGSNLTDLATRQHAGLTNITSDQHHPQVHAHAHGDLTGISADQHHPQAHTLVSHTARDHHNLVGLADDDHSQYYNAARHTTAVHDALSINAHRLDGYHGASASTANTYALRDSAGDIHARLFRSEYDTLNATCNIFMTQIDTVSNNYIRPSTKAQVIASLRAQAWAFTGMVTARDHGTAAVDEVVNVCYGTGDPPVASTTTIGTIYIKYTP